MIEKKKLGLLGGIERNILVRWLRFSRRHRDSNKLPLFYFLLLFVDGFVMVIPSTLFLMAAVTISPKRWKFFAFLFPVAATLNNTATYFLGRIFPHDAFLDFITSVNLDLFWAEAIEAIQKYGSWATFIGTIFSLPTQMITALIGLADSSHVEGDFQKISIIPALALVFLGQSIKGGLIAWLVRYGWLKFEKKYSA